MKFRSPLPPSLDVPGPSERHQAERRPTEDGDPYGPLVRERDAQEAPQTTLTAGSLADGVETAAAMWVDALDGLDNAELRVSEHAFEMAIYRFDDWLIVSP